MVMRRKMIVKSRNSCRTMVAYRLLLGLKQYFNKRTFEQLLLAKSFSPPKEQKLTCYLHSSWLAARTDWKVSAINNFLQRISMPTS